MGSSRNQYVELLRPVDVISVIRINGPLTLEEALTRQEDGGEIFELVQVEEGQLQDELDQEPA